MRLIKCHISGFGKWNDFTYDFSQGTNVFCEENGWGKSTLAQFIKVMLYGLQNDSVRDELKNERKRFAPWSKGTFGGELQFEVNGKQYEVRRVFGKKVSEDEFELIHLDDHQRSSDYTTNLGEELFQIDANSFERTVFISQNDCYSATTDSINAKIGNLADNSDDINNFDTADARLKKLLDSMSPTRKTGSISRLKTEVAVLEQELKATANLQNTIEEIEAKRDLSAQKRETLGIQLEELRHKQVELSNYKDLQAKKQRYDAILDECRNRQAIVEEKRAFFGEKIPTKDEIRQQITTCTQRNRADEMIQLYALTEDEEKEYQNTFAEYGEKLPTIEEVRVSASKAAEFDSLTVEDAKLRLTAEEEAKWRELRDEYSEKMPDETVLSSMRSQFKYFLDKKQDLNQNETSLRALELLVKQQETMKPQKSRSISIFLIVGVLCVILGIAVCFVLLPLGIGLVAAGLALLVIGVLQKPKKVDPQPQENPELVILREDTIQAREEMETTRGVLEEFCRAQGSLFIENEFIEYLSKLQRDAEKYKELSDKVTRQVESGIGEKLNMLRNDLGEFWKQIGRETLPTNSILPEMTKIMEQVQRFKELQTKKQQWQTQADLKKELEQQITDFFRQYELTVEADYNTVLDGLMEKLNALDTAQLERNAAEEKKREIEKTLDLQEIQAISNVEQEETLEALTEQSEEISQKMRELFLEIQNYNSQLEEKQELLDDMVEKGEHLKNQKEDLDNAKVKYELLTQTKDLLQKAKQNFTAKYTEPIMKGFRKYYTFVSGLDTEKFEMDANTKLTILQDSMSRDIGFQSSGSRDLIGICMRMALVEAMYEQERPFLIMDDPFVNLDNEKTKGAMALLNEIAKDYQIIYFTCHDSRVGQ